LCNRRKYFPGDNIVDDDVDVDVDVEVELDVGIDVEGVDESFSKNT